jgi:hypothetical protein
VGCGSDFGGGAEDGFIDRNELNVISEQFLIKLSQRVFLVLSGKTKVSIQSSSLLMRLIFWACCLTYNDWSIVPD